MDLSRFPRRRYTPFVTPLEPLPRFSAALAATCPGGQGPEVWIKRDDMLGLFPGGGGSQRLMRQIPLCQAKMLMFTGDFVSAHEAVRLGLVNRAVPRAQLLPEALALARRIADKSPWALRLLKGSMGDGADMPLSAALRHEQATISLLLDTKDAHEGCSAFLEKRTPVFRGR